MNRRLREDDYMTPAVKCAWLASLIACCCLLPACNRPRSAPPPDNTPGGDIIATVGGQAILLTEYQAELERRAHRLSRAGAKEELLEELVKSEALYLRAKQAGFEQRPDIARQIKQFIVHRFIEEQNTSEAAPASDKEVADYYRADPTRFTTPARVRFAVIEFGHSPKATEARKDEVQQKAAAVLAEAHSSGASESTFGALAQRHSEDQATRYVGGDSGWVSRNESSRWPSAVIEAAFALEKQGELAPVITTAAGCYLVKLLERKEAGRRPLAKVAEVIRYELAIKARHRAQDEFYNAAKADVAIEINHALLNSLPAPSPPIAAPPALPGS